MNSVLDMFDFVAGEHPWNFADFDTQQGPMRAGGNHKGLFVGKGHQKWQHATSKIGVKFR